MKVKRLKDVNFLFNYDPSYPFIVEDTVNGHEVYFTKREALSFVRFFIKHASLTSKERLDLHQCIMNEQYTQKRSKK